MASYNGGNRTPTHNEVLSNLAGYFSLPENTRLIENPLLVSLKSLDTVYETEEVVILAEIIYRLKDAPRRHRDNRDLAKFTGVPLCVLESICIKYTGRPINRLRKIIGVPSRMEEDTKIFERPRHRVTLPRDLPPG